MAERGVFGRMSAGGGVQCAGCSAAEWWVHAGWTEIVRVRFRYRCGSVHVHPSTPPVRRLSPRTSLSHTHTHTHTTRTHALYLSRVSSLRTPYTQHTHARTHARAHTHTRALSRSLVRSLAHNTTHILSLARTPYTQRTHTHTHTLYLSHSLDRTLFRARAFSRLPVHSRFP